jgi:hypothetical protein
MSEYAGRVAQESAAPPSPSPRLRPRHRMIHFTAFGATQAEISPGGFTAVTVFGGAELRRPTLAKRIMQRRAEQRRAPSTWEKWLGMDRSIAITLFGGTEIIAPTLVEEYAALRNLLTSGAITREECRDMLDSLGREDDGDISRLTFFGACTQQSPKASNEKKALDVAESAGMIDAGIRAQLMQAIGCPPDTAAEVVLRAALA